MIDSQQLKPVLSSYVPSQSNFVDWQQTQVLYILQQVRQRFLRVVRNSVEWKMKRRDGFIDRKQVKGSLFDSGRNGSCTLERVAQ
jgi:hypothetical protein